MSPRARQMGLDLSLSAVRIISCGHGSHMINPKLFSGLMMVMMMMTMMMMRRRRIIKMRMKG
jgi:hypothetical protein